MNAIHSDKQIKRYRKKYKFIKMRIKSLILAKKSPTSLQQELNTKLKFSSSYWCSRLHLSLSYRTLEELLHLFSPPWFIMFVNQQKSGTQENAALCDEVARVQESILIVKDERRFLLHKLMEYENDSEQFYYRNEPVITSNGSKTKIKKRQSCDDAR